MLFFSKRQVQVVNHCIESEGKSRSCLKCRESVPDSNRPAIDNGITLLVINTQAEPASLNLPSDAEQYTLTSNELEGTQVLLNGQELKLGSDDELPELIGSPVPSGDVNLPATSITFFTLSDAM